jgi:hypothetical protein
MMAKPQTATARRRRLAWRTLPADDDVRAVYARIEQELGATARTQKEARAGVNYLYQFVLRFREARADPPHEQPDPRILSGTQQDLQYADAAWNAMRRDALWGPTYIREVRTSLSRALLLFGEPLAHVVNPGLYKGACTQTQFRVTRSHQTAFTLHDCLPWRVRRMPPRSVEYALLGRIGERLSGCLASVSKNHLQSILVLFDQGTTASLVPGFDHVLHDPPSIWPAEGGLEERWEFLHTLSPRDWLERYAATFVAADANHPRRIGFDLFKRQVRYLSQFHSRVLHPDTKRCIPMPARHRAGTPTGREGVPVHTAAVGGRRGRGVLVVVQRLLLRFDRGGPVRPRRGRPRGAAGACQPAGRPSPALLSRAPASDDGGGAHVRLLPAGGTTAHGHGLHHPGARAPRPAVPCREQLILVLFLTTGLRLAQPGAARRRAGAGGVARLRLLGSVPHSSGRARAPCVPPPPATEVPDELTTTEKHNRVRCIRPTSAVRPWEGRTRPRPAAGCCWRGGTRRGAAPRPSHRTCSRVPSGRRRNPSARGTSGACVAVSSKQAVFRGMRA